MGASCVHGHVEAFYAPQAREGTQILQINTSKSVETIRGHTSAGLRRGGGGPGLGSAGEGHAAPRRGAILTPGAG
jgi:hypothetical protein